MGTCGAALLPDVVSPESDLLMVLMQPRGRQERDVQIIPAVRSGTQCNELDAAQAWTSASQEAEVLLRPDGAEAAIPIGSGHP
jgi:hypothetical protein